MPWYHLINRFLINSYSYSFLIILFSLGKNGEHRGAKKKVSFIEQAKKRTDSYHLASYIMSIDLMLNSALHQVTDISMYSYNLVPILIFKNGL